MITPYYVEAGTGPVLVCLHGIGSSHRSFEAQLSGLSRTFRVVAWDAPGYGRSADPGSAPGMDGYAATVADLIEGLGGRAHLLGVSWGGVIATQVAITYPRLLRSLTLVGASVGSGRDPQSAAAMRERARELSESGAQSFAARRAPRLLSDQAEPALVAKAVQIMAEDVRLPGYGYAAEAMASTDLRPRLPQIVTPTLVLAGSEDTITGPTAADSLASGIRAAIFGSVAGAGHLANQQRPEVVNAWASAFMQTIDHASNRATIEGEQS